MLTPRLGALLITLAVLVAFEPVRHNEFVWDDEQNLLLNDQWRGLGAEQLTWMFTSFHGGHYQPLTWLSFAIEYELQGKLSSLGIHVVNVLIHALNAILVFAISRRMLSASNGAHDGRLQAGALFAALLFAVHPLRVESVAWATERRDVLSTFWLLLALCFYLRAVSIPIRPSGSPRATMPLARGAFWLAFLCYLLSLLSKATGITFPVVLLILDVFPLRRLHWSTDRNSLMQGVTVLAEKVVFAIPASVAGAIALWAQSNSGALRDFATHALDVRVAQALYGLCFYVAKTVWPVNLSPLYEVRPSVRAFDPIHVLSAFAVAVSVMIACSVRRRAPGVLAALMLYAVILAPMLGFAQSGSQWVADRYSYVACIPLAVLAGAGFQRFGVSSIGAKVRSGLIVPAVAAALLVMIMLTRAQVGVWRDPYVLWTTVLARRPDTGLAHANLALLLGKRGAYTDARDHALRALEILPGSLASHTALGMASLELDDPVTAEEHLRFAIGMRERLQKPDASVYAAMGMALAQLNHPAEAESQFRTAIRVDPRNPSWALALSVFYASRNRLDDARQLLEKLVQEAPDRPEIYLRLGWIQEQTGSLGDAIRTWKIGLQHAPGDVDLRTQLAWVLATTTDDSVRDGNRARELAVSAVRDSTQKNLRAIEALAAAYAELGQFDEAIETLKEAPTNNERAIDRANAARLSQELERFRKHEPLRE